MKTIILLAALILILIQSQNTLISNNGLDIAKNNIGILPIQNL